MVKQIRAVLSIPRIFAPLVTLVALSSPAYATAPAAAGEQTFQSMCGMCHGPDGKGDTPVAKQMKVRNLRSAEVQKQSNAELQKIITEGKNTMPAFGSSLSPADIKGLLAYIRSIRGKS